MGTSCILNVKEEWNKKEDFLRGPYLLGTVPGGDAESQQLSYFIKPSIIQRVLEFILKHQYFKKIFIQAEPGCLV